MSSYNIVASTNESTVVAEYIPETSRSDAYQSEAALECEFIRLLTAQGYEYLTIHDENALVSNLRRQLELLNNYTFSDDEWRRFFTECIASNSEGIVEKTRKIQTDQDVYKRQQLLSAAASPFGRALSEYQCMQYALDKPGVLTVLPGVRGREDVRRVLGFLAAAPEEKDYSVLGTFSPQAAGGAVSYTHLFKT